MELIDHPRSPTIRVALNRLRQSPESLLEQHETSGQPSSSTTSDSGPVLGDGAVLENDNLEHQSQDLDAEEEEDVVSPSWKERLRPRKKTARGRYLAPLWPVSFPKHQ